MLLNVELTKPEEDKLIERAKDEVREELTTEALLKCAKESRILPLKEFLNKFALADKVEWLNKTMVQDLSQNDKLALALYWLMYEKLG